ncbi:hypothetical protein MP228_007299 [Amoeboaphelidium protococcarum]|nr:hypothetical protein MP228_007299 [Amoeboaphelidium protococcarum]
MIIDDRYSKTRVQKLKHYLYSFGSLGPHGRLSCTILLNQQYKTANLKKRTPVDDCHIEYQRQEQNILAHQVKDEVSTLKNQSNLHDDVVDEKSVVQCIPVLNKAPDESVDALQQQQEQTVVECRQNNADPVYSTENQISPRLDIENSHTPKESQRSKVQLLQKSNSSFGKLIESTKSQCSAVGSRISSIQAGDQCDDPFGFKLDINSEAIADQQTLKTNTQSVISSIKKRLSQPPRFEDAVNKKPVDVPSIVLPPDEHRVQAEIPGQVADIPPQSHILNSNVLSNQTLKDQLISDDRMDTEDDELNDIFKFIEGDISAVRENADEDDLFESDL